MARFSSLAWKVVATSPDTATIDDAAVEHEAVGRCRHRPRPHRPEPALEHDVERRLLVAQVRDRRPQDHRPVVHLGGLEAHVPGGRRIGHRAGRLDREAGPRQLQAVVGVAVRGRVGPERAPVDDGLAVGALRVGEAEQPLRDQRRGAVPERPADVELAAVVREGRDPVLREPVVLLGGVEDAHAPAVAALALARVAPLALRDVGPPAVVEGIGRGHAGDDAGVGRGAAPNTGQQGQGQDDQDEDHGQAEQRRSRDAGGSGAGHVQASGGRGSGRVEGSDRATARPDCRAPDAATSVRPGTGRDRPRWACVALVPYGDVVPDRSPRHPPRRPARPPRRPPPRRHRGCRHRRADRRAAAQGGRPPGDDPRGAQPPRRPHLHVPRLRRRACTASSGRCASRASTTWASTSSTSGSGSPRPRSRWRTRTPSSTSTAGASAAASSPLDSLRLRPAGARARHGRRSTSCKDAMAPLIELIERAGRLGAAHRALRPLLAPGLAHRARRERAGARADGPAVQPRGPLPLLARGVVQPLARGRLRRPRVHRRGLRHAGRRVRAGAPGRHPPGRRGPRRRAARRTASPSATGRRGRRSVGGRRRVHPDRAVRAPAAHGDQRPGRRQVVHDPQRLLRPGAQDLHAVQPPLVGGRLRDHPRRDGHRPRHPQRGLHAGRPGPVHRQGRAHRVLRLGAGLHGLLHARRAPAHHPGAGGPRQDPPRGARDVRVRHLARLGAGPARRRASARCSGRSR